MTVRRKFRRSPLTGFLPLEDRSVPATFTATINPTDDNAGAVAEIVGFFNQVNSNSDTTDTVNLFPGGRYVFNVDASDDTFGSDADPSAFNDGGTALPVFTTQNSGPVADTYNTFTNVTPTTLTVNGQGATFERPAGAPSFRFLRAFGAIEQSTREMQTGTQNGQPVTTTITNNAPMLATLNVNNLTMIGGNVYDFRGFDLATNTKISNPAGGAVRTDLGQANLSNVVLDSNTSTLGGGAVYIGPTLGLAQIATMGPTVTVSTFDAVKFTNNYAGTQGGAVAIDNTGDSAIRSFGFFTNSTIDGNLSITGAGGVHGLTAATIFGKKIDGSIGGTIIKNNRGDAGGVVASSVELYSSLLSGNTATGGGTGAVTATEQMLIINRSTITGNQSGIAGAVVGQASGLAVEVVSSTIHSNLGGNSTIQATQGEVVLTFATITNNTTSGGDTAGVSVPNNILTISQSVISGNRVPNTQSAFTDIQSPLLRNQGFNFIGVAPTNYPLLPGDTVGRVGAEKDPLLGPLGQSGGITVGFPADNFGALPVRLPANGSPLIGAAGVPKATRLSTDERGLPRPASGGNADIGAVEAQPGETLPTSVPLPPPLVPPPPPVTGTLVPPPATTGVPPVIAVGPGPIAAVRAANSNLPPPGFLVSSGSSVTAGTGSSQPAGPPDVAYLYNPDGTVKLTVTPFGFSIPGGIRVATGDLTGDGVADLIAGTGPGVANQVKVFDGLTGTLLTTLSPFESGFTGGVFVAAGDLTGDGVPELVVTPDNGGGARVIVYAAPNYNVIVNFFGIADPNFRGGARVAVGDVTGDGVGDLIVVAGTGGGPRVSIWDGSSIVNGAFTVNPIPDFFVFEPGLRNGVYIAAGDVNADGFADLIVGGGPGGAPRVQVLSGLDLIQSGTQTAIANFFAGDPNRRDGVPVGVADLDGLPNADVTTGGGATPTVFGYFGLALVANGGAQAPDLTINPFSGYSGGVFVG